MSAGLVSIILPSLNARRFLEPRVESILAQSYRNWEAIVLDSHSDDGTWEYFEELASRDARFRLFRIPRDGFYAAVNRGFDLSTGDFVHIATCDDTMADGFLEKCVRALEQFPEAGLAVTDLEYIDAEGVPDTSGRLGRGYVRTMNPRRAPEVPNLRRAPHDHLLHMTLETVCFSLTQVVARRSLVEGRSRFSTTSGSVADFQWMLELTRSHGVVHIPEKLATWRSHGAQLSYHEDVRRKEYLCGAVRKSLEEPLPGFGWNRRLALMLPAWRTHTTKHPFRSSLWFVGGIALGILAMELIRRPASFIPSMLAASFGAAELKESWIAFLMHQWRISPPEEVSLVQ